MKPLLFKEILARITSVSSFKQSQHAYMALCFRTSRMSVSIWINVAQPTTRTPDVNSQTVGRANESVHYGSIFNLTTKRFESF